MKVEEYKLTDIQYLRKYIYIYTEIRKILNLFNVSGDIISINADLKRDLHFNENSKLALLHLIERYHCISINKDEINFVSDIIESVLSNQSV